MSKIKKLYSENKSLSLYLSLSYYYFYFYILILFSFIKFKNAFEINLIQDKNNNDKISIYKTNWLKENRTFKSLLFNYEEDNLLQNSFSTNCPFNRIYFETYDTKETLIEINFFETKKIFNLIKNNYLSNNLNSLLKSQSQSSSSSQKELNSEFEFNDLDFDSYSDFPIINITNNKESFPAYFEIMQNYTKEYYIEFNEENKSFYLKGKLFFFFSFLFFILIYFILI
jgi:hypothetical protein